MFTFFPELMSIKVNICVLVIKEFLLFLVLQAQTLLLLFLKKKLYSGLMEDIFYKLKKNFFKVGK
jgi:hypothetical protein